jgi:hypothetical protein
MHKIALFSALLYLGYALLFQSGVADALLMFLLSGGIPGTAVVIPPNLMMVGLAAIAWLVLFRMTALGAVNLVTMRQLVSRATHRQSRMPKRRYGRI